MNSLLAIARQGDSAAESKIFEFLLVRFDLLARRKIGDTDAAHDVAQKACLIIFEKYRTQTFSVSFVAWAYGVLQMCIKSYHHTLVRDRRTITDGSGEVTHSPQYNRPPADPELELKLLKCLRALVLRNPRYARALNLSYQGFKVDEICERLNLNRNSLYVLLNRARSSLRQCLDQEEASHDPLS